MYNLVARAFPQSLAKKLWQPVCELKYRALKKNKQKNSIQREFTKVDCNGAWFFSLNPYHFFFTWQWHWCI